MTASYCAVGTLKSLVDNILFLAFQTFVKHFRILKHAKERLFIPELVKIRI